ncbi:MAG: hypothetical protein JOS17DRAFT_799457, partial [Linnemannia elongata]
MRFWGLGKVRELRELYLDPYCSVGGGGAVGYKREECMSILHVCTGLESFICGGVFLEMRRFRSGQESRSGEKKGPSLPMAFTSPNSEGYSLRRLHIQSSPLDVPAFHHLVGLCPFLEELTISRAQGASFTSKTWTLLSQFCPRLQMVRLENDELVTQHMPDLGDILMMFPVLKSLELVDCRFERDPDLVALGARLRELKAEQDGKPHPLKRLALTGAMGHSTQILADALTNLEAVALQSLTVGKTSSLLPFQQRQQGWMSVSQILEWDEPFVDLSVRWTCFETLSLLDFTKVDFPPSTLNKIFPLVAQSCNLHSLGVAWTQLLSLYNQPINPVTKRAAWALSIKLPYLQKIAIGCGYERRKFRTIPLTSDILGALLKAAPGVRKVGIRTGIEVEVEGVSGGRVEGWESVFLGVEFVYLT